MFCGRTGLLCLQRAALPVVAVHIPVAVVVDSVVADFRGVGMDVRIQIIAVSVDFGVRVAVVIHVNGLVADVLEYGLTSYIELLEVTTWVKEVLVRP